MRIKALDSIRGILLLQMTLDHFGKPISNYLYQCFGFFSAAEGFFFLSGFVGALAAISKGEKDPKQTWMRKRALKTWKYHCVTLAAIVIAACTLLPSIAWYFKSLSTHPVAGAIWSALLINTPEYLDVLPLYVLFLFCASVIFPWMQRSLQNAGIAWGASFILWIASQLGLREAINAQLPSWINHGFFDPTGWQFVYMTGATIATLWKHAPQESVQKFFKKLDFFIPAIFVLLIFLFLWHHQILPIQEPAEIWTSKAQVGAIRFANFMFFVGAISWIVRKFPSALDIKITNVIGRHSLDVFTAHIVLVYLWFATPGEIRYHAPWNVLAPIAACILLWGIAKARER